MGNSDHVVVSIFIDFSSNSKRDILFHRKAYHYSCVDWEGLRDHLRDVSWEDILSLVLLLLVVNSVSRFRLGLIHYNLHREYQVKPHSSLWFSAACADAIVHRNGVQLLVLLLLIKQNCLLKTFLRTLILMNQVSLNLFSLLELT